MRLTNQFKEITDSSTINEHDLIVYLSDLYSNKDYDQVHKSYKNQDVNYEDENTISNEETQIKYSLKLIEEITKLSQKDKFLELKSIFQKHVLAGEMRTTLCLIKESLEAIAYRLEKKIPYSKTLFDIQLSNSSFEVYFPRILTHITSLLQIMSDDFYSIKFGYLETYTKEYLKKFHYNEQHEPHILNSFLSSISNTYKITPTEDFIKPEIQDRILKSFKTDLDQHLNSKEGCYSFISYISNIFAFKLQDYQGIEIKHLDDSKKEVETLIASVGAEPSSALEFNTNSNNEYIVSLKPNLEELLTVSLTKKLINDGIIKHEFLYFNDGTVVPTPLGWYMVSSENINDPVENIEKLIDYKDLKGLHINGYDMEYRLLTLLKDLCDKSFKEALIHIFEENKLGNDFDETTIGKKLFLLSEPGSALKYCFSSYKEILSLTDQEFSSWKDLLTSMNPKQHLYDTIGLESFEPFIINKNIISNDIKLLMNHTTKSLLHIAVIISNTNLVRLLLAYVRSEPMCNKDSIDANGDTALSIAVAAKDIEMIKLLLTYNSRVDIKNLDGKTAVQLAIDTNDINVVSIILESINNNIKDIQGNEILQYAIKANSDLDIIKLLMDFAYTDINSKNLDGKTAMHLAVKHKDSCDIINMLIERDAKISFDILDKTPLFYSALSNNIQAMGILINAVKKSWTKEEAETEFLSVLFKVIESSECIELIKTLLSFFDSSTLNKCNKDGENLIHIAIFNKGLCLDIITLLHGKYGLDCNAQDKYLNTPLHDACFNGDFDAIAALLTINDIKINLTNLEGDTPLHALMNSAEFTIETLNLLLINGADPCAKNNKNKTAIDALEANQQIKNENFVCKIKEILSTYNNYDKKRPLDINQNPDFICGNEPKSPKTLREGSSTYIPDDQNIKHRSIAINIPSNINIPTKTQSDSMNLQR